jgi:hypothetical protein
VIIFGEASRQRAGKKWGFRPDITTARADIEAIEIPIKEKAGDRGRLDSILMP